MQVKITGKIQKSIRYENSYHTILVTPAVDEWSKPSVFKVSSPNPLGDKDDLVQCICDLSGYVKINKYNDKNTGDQREFWNQVVTFTVTSSQPYRKPQSSQAA